MHPPAGNASRPSDRVPGRGRSGLGPRRVVWLSFAVSILVHASFVALYPLFMPELRPENASFPLPAFSGPPQGVEVIRVVEVADVPDPARPDEPEEIEEVTEPEADADRPFVPGVPEGDLPPPPLSGAELLRPNLTDARLWAPPDPEDVALTMEEREQLAIAGRLEAWYDSLAAAAAADAAATDWTYTDDEGRRWGVSPGQLHLGGVTLPLPFGFGTTPGKREIAAERVWQWEEITRQGEQATVRDSWKARAEAIRARRDAERAKARPDTTRSR